MSDFAYYVFGQEPAVAVHLALWYVLLVCHQYDVCENSVGSVYVIVPGMFVCSSFLISVCMFIVSKALLISSATVIVRAGGSIWMNPFVTVLFSVCRDKKNILLSNGGLSESGLCVFCKLCPVCFLVVGNGPSVLL